MIKKILKNRTFLGIFSIFLALVISFGITPMINKKTSAQTEIIRVKKDIKQGEEITSDNIDKVKVGSYNLPSDAITNEEDLISKYAKVDMYKGDFFFKEKVSDIKKIQDHYLYNTFNKNIAISATLKSEAKGLSGKLQEGDIVTIIAKTGEEEKFEIIKELMYVRILSVTSKGVDKGETEEMPNTVTFSVNDIQAEKVAELEATGEMHIALTYRGDQETANSYLQIQHEYFVFLEENKLIDGIYEVIEDPLASFIKEHENITEEELRYLDGYVNIQSRNYEAYGEDEDVN